MCLLLLCQGKGLTVQTASLALRRCQALQATAIHELSLSHNALEMLPSFLPATLVYLDVSHNAIDALPDLCELASLTKLNISHNNIASLLGLSFNTALQALNASDNRHGSP